MSLRATEHKCQSGGQAASASQKHGFGVPPHCFRDCFSMSKTLARDCCRNFHDGLIQLHLKECLRAPTQADLKAITKLHKLVHRGVDGMLGKHTEPFPFERDDAEWTIGQARIGCDSVPNWG